MKRRISIAVAALILFLVIAGAFVIFSSRPLLSSDQVSIRDMYGPPDQFAISYVPRGEDEAVRQETWTYAEQALSFVFTGGSLLRVDPLDDEMVPLASTSILPEDIWWDSSLDELESLTGEALLPREIPGLADEDTPGMVYANTIFMIVMEGDMVTYAQTFDVDENALPENQGVTEPVPTEAPRASRTYINTALGIRMDYPAAWFLADNDIVLSSYDTAYMEKGLPLPDIRLKCDFLPKDADPLRVADETVLKESPVRIVRSKAEESEDGLGYGDGMVFAADTDGGTIRLLCYAYDPSFEKEIIDMLASIRKLE